MTNDTYDIVIVGAGPVGLLLAACLARWGYKIKLIDNRDVPTSTGRADGIQPRSLHLLRNMGLKRAIMAHDPAKVYEVAFWDPMPDGQGIKRTGNCASCPKFIDARYPFTTLLHQGLIERVLIDDLGKHDVAVQRPWTITGFENNGKAEEYPIEVNLKHVKIDEQSTVSAKYLFSGEGARSFIRDQLKIEIHYKDPIQHIWGVMDGVVRTDFPDIKVGALTWAAPEGLILSAEMHHTLRPRLHHGHSSRSEHGPTVHTTCIIHRQGMESKETSHGRGGPGLCQGNSRTVLYRVGSGGMVLRLPNRSRHSRKIHFGS